MTIRSHTNRAVVLAHRPDGAAHEDCFSLAERDLPVMAADDVLVRNIYLSCDPYMRGQLAEHGGYKAAFEIGAVIPARVVGQVAESRNAHFKVGDFVWGFLGWELFTHVSEGAGLRHVDPALGPVSHAISVLGMPGLTADVGVRICAPGPGDTFYVSAASGAVGQVAGQLARAAGARVVGSAGTAEKVRFLIDQLGFDAAFNYRTSSSVADALARLCPTGIDAYFDNVGGETLDAVLARLNPRARIAVCGQISQYDHDAGNEGYRLRNFGAILGTRSTITGFSVRDNMDQFDAVVADLAARMHRGELHYREDIVCGLEATPAAFVGMMRGDNIGKRLVRVSDDQLCASHPDVPRSAPPGWPASRPWQGSGWLSIAEARGAAGVRVTDSPYWGAWWAQALRAILRLKGIPYQKVVHPPFRDTDPEAQRELFDWTAQTSVPTMAFRANPGDPEIIRNDWLGQLLLAEQICPAPALVPSDPHHRIRCLGLTAEIMSPQGLMWNGRIAMFELFRSAAMTEQQQAFVGRGEFLGGKYSSKTKPGAAIDNVRDALQLLDGYLADNQATGSPYFVGDELSALDVYWAYASNFALILPPDELPVMSFNRAMYGGINTALADALTPRLREHRDRVLRHYLGLPVVVD